MTITSWPSPDLGPAPLGNPTFEPKPERPPIDETPCFRPGPYPEDWVPTFRELELLATQAERLAETFDGSARALAKVAGADPTPLLANAALQRRTARVLRWAAARASRLHELAVADRKPARFGSAGQGRAGP